MLDVCLLGTGGMMPLPYRWLTSLMIRYEGSQLLIDCGEGTQIAAKIKGWSFKPIDVICFTHYHADHISGLPGLLLTMGNAERTEPLKLIGPRGLERVVNALRTIAPELPFPLEFRELTEREEDIQAGPYQIHASGSTIMWSATDMPSPFPGRESFRWTGPGSWACRSSAGIRCRRAGPWSIKGRGIHQIWSWDRHGGG